MLISENSKDRAKRRGGREYSFTSQRQTLFTFYSASFQCAVKPHDNKLKNKRGAPGGLS